MGGSCRDLPLLFLNCYGDWTPVKGTTADVGDIVTPMMHDDVIFHIVSVYIRLHCASLSVVLVFEAEQSYSEYLLLHPFGRNPDWEN